MTVLAKAAPPSNDVVPGVLGFLVVAGMSLILYFLLRSLNKQLHKVVGAPSWRGKDRAGEPGEPGESGPEPGTPGAPGTSGTATRPSAGARGSG